MAEKSYFHNGTSRGDAADAPIGDTLFHTIMQSMYNNDGVIYDDDYLTALTGTVSGIDMDVDVLAGSAFVQGVYFNSDAVEAFTIDTVVPDERFRFDRIVIRINWAEKTARLAVVKGAEEIVPVLPALQQDFGVIWEFPLLRVYLIGGSNIILQTSVYDERMFLNNANCPPIINIMHNSEFIANANTSFDGEAPAYWWTTGGYTVENSGVGLDLQSRGRAVQLVDTDNTDLLETDLYACDLSTTYYPDETPLTIAFYVQASGGSFAVDFDGGAGAMTYLIAPTAEPVLILYRCSVSSAFNTVGFYIRSYGGPATLDVYQVTTAFGPNPAPFLPNRETIFYGTKVAMVGSPFTRSTGTYTLYPGSAVLLPVTGEALGVYMLQRAWDAGSAGADVIYAALGNIAIGASNNIRTEVGRLTNDTRRQHLGLTPYATFEINVVASGAGALTQELYNIGCET